ncbi:DUF1501 domain-containing protein [Acidobacteria bacterium AH-259-G07]|nr:DUF1501 domain-containing protein [Acidobacteria bacterium AH-259-G07]
MITRRIFLKNGGLAVLGMGTVPTFLFRTAMAASPAGRKKVLVTIFQRGGADGLNIVVPFGEKNYYSYRPSIAIPAPSKKGTSALDLDGFFGLHPSLKPLLPVYKEGNLGIIPAAGSPDPTRSHFDAQDFMESGTPGNKLISDGWLNRYLYHNRDPRATAFRGLSVGEMLPRSLKGRAPALALKSVSEFGLDVSKANEQGQSLYESLYHEETNSLLSGTAQEMFDAIDFLKKANLDQYQPAPGVKYANNPFAQSLKQVAQLIKADVGLEVACVDIGGWDDHSNEVFQLTQRLQRFGGALAAFYRDLGDRMEDVVVLSMSEFGRTARENGSAGTDHGHANVMFVMGGPVKGGKVYGQWPGLAQEQLNEDRDLALTTDFRDVLAEALVRHLGCQKAEAVFPGFKIDAQRFTGMI